MTDELRYCPFAAAADEDINDKCICDACSWWDDICKECVVPQGVRYLRRIDATTRAINDKLTMEMIASSPADVSRRMLDLAGHPAPSKKPEIESAMRFIAGVPLGKSWSQWREELSRCPSQVKSGGEPKVGVACGVGGGPCPSKACVKAGKPDRDAKLKQFKKETAIVTEEPAERVPLEGVKEGMVVALGYVSSITREEGEVVVQWEPTEEGQKLLDDLNITFNKNPLPGMMSTFNEKKRPPIVCLCGSTRFMDDYNAWRKRLTYEGKIVLGVEIVTTQAEEEDPQHVDPERKAMLDDLHLRKIDIADEVFVLNVGGYIGESTRAEIDYAEKLGKPVGYLESPTTKAGEGKVKE